MLNTGRKYALYLFSAGIQTVLFSYYLIKALGPKPAEYFYYESVALFFNPNKRTELYGYMTGVCLLGLFILTVIFSEKLASPNARRKLTFFFSHILNPNRKADFILSISLLFLLPAAIFVLGIHPLIATALQFSLLVSVFSMPFGIFRKIHRNINKISVNLLSNGRLGYVMVSLIIVGFVQLFFVLYGTIFHNPKIINEFLTIPETTFVDGKPENNTEYWNRNFPSAVTNKTDIHTQYDKNCLINKGIFGNEVTLFNSVPGYSYNSKSGRFCINTADYNEVIPYAGNKELKDILLLNSEKNAKLQSTEFEGNKKQFINNNLFEIHWQILSRFMFHHNSFVYVPVIELHLGRDLKEINAQYGLGIAKLFETVLEKTDNLSLDGILKISYIFYYLYFALFGLAVFFITRSLTWTALLFITALTFFNLRGYTFRIMPPGDAAWRHFFDVSVVLMLFLYAKSRNLIWLISALLLSVISVFMNPQIGIMILSATAASTIFYSLYEKRRIAVTILLTVVSIAAGLTLFVICSTENDIAGYYFDGVIGFRAPLRFAVILFAFFITGYLLIKYLIRNRKDHPYLHLIFLAIYVQELFLYVIWHFNFDGILARSYFYVLLLLILMPYINSCTEKTKRNIAIYSLAALTVLYPVSVLYLNYTKLKYEKIFDRHVTYNWDMKRAKITSTMDPKYFQNAVDLIQKYSGKQNGIYIVSEFDNILPFLSDKYSLMPFFDLKWYHITPKEVEKSINTLKKDNPDYIFVDSRYYRNLNNEILDPAIPRLKYLQEESEWRVQRLKLLYSVFESVEDRYELAEKGYLISVYKKKQASE